MVKVTRRTIVGGLAAAGTGLLPIPAIAQRAQLKMWTFLATQGTDPRSAALNAVVAAFNKAQPKYEVSVESINFARIDNNVIQATAAGQGPDILNVYSDQLSMHVAAKTIAPLDKYITTMQATERNDFLSKLDSFSFGGKSMAIPWETRVWLLWYRKDLLEAAKVGAPKTLEELGQVAAKITTDQVMGFGIGASSGALGAGAMEAFVPIFWGAGGQLFDASGKATVDSDAGVRTLAFFRDLVTRHKGMRQTVVSMTVDELMSAYRAGTVGMTMMGSFRVAGARSAPATGQNLQTAPIPGFTADKPTPARLAGQTLTIGINSKQPEGAWEFIRHYTATASQIEFAKAGVMPSRASTYATSEFGALNGSAELRGWTDYAREHGRFEPTPPDFSKLSEEVAKAMQKVIVAGADPKAAISEAASAYNAQRR